MKRKITIIAAVLILIAGTLGAQSYFDGYFTNTLTKGTGVFPSGSVLDIESGAALKLSGTAITATAAEVNKLAGLSGDVISTTNTKTLTNKTLSGPIFSIATHVFTTTADWVLSSAEALCTLLIADSGSGGANIIESGGVAGRVKILRNDGDGTFTIKESGQTGVSVAAAKTAVVMHNGTDYIRVTADATH